MLQSTRNTYVSVSKSGCRRQYKQRVVLAGATKNKRPVYVPGKISDPKYVRIFDTTLRDGEQSPGATLTSTEKMEIAKTLSSMKVDIIEAGFPIASRDDFLAVQQIANEVGNNVADDGFVPVICGLSRTKKKDIETAWDAVKGAKLPRIHTFIATSNIHMKYKLKMTKEQVKQTAVDCVTLCRELGCNDIEFSPEDAGRSDIDFLYEVLGAVIEAGATTLNIPDTTGWNLPHEYGELINKLVKNTPGADKVVFSCHCQNDLGLSVANSLSGVLNGARQVECTINGIGERAGNTSLEEVVMAIALRGDEVMDSLWTGINPVHIYPASRMVSDYSGMVVQPHKAIVGRNAFQHESGIHQDGMLKSAQTYEIMSPETIGLFRSDAAGLVIGKHSGRHALQTRLKELGYEYEGQALDDMFVKFKALADKKKNVQDEDLMVLVGEEIGSVNAVWALEDLQIMCGTLKHPTASVKLRGPDGITRMGLSHGSGPVDAAFRAVQQVVQVHCKLLQYNVLSVTQGISAQAVTRVLVQPSDGILEDMSQVKTAQGRVNTRKFTGNGADVDIVTSSVLSYINALNKVISYASTVANDPERFTIIDSVDEQVDLTTNGVESSSET